MSEYVLHTHTHTYIYGRCAQDINTYTNMYKHGFIIHILLKDLPVQKLFCITDCLSSLVQEFRIFASLVNFSIMKSSFSAPQAPKDSKISLLWPCFKACFMHHPM